MKISKARLKKIIKEELESVFEAPEAPTPGTGVKRGEFRKAGVAQARAAQSGIDDAEREEIQTLNKLMQQVAAKQNLNQGRISMLIDKLKAELLGKAPAEEAPAEV